VSEQEVCANRQSLPVASLYSLTNLRGNNFALLYIRLKQAIAKH
jgi:hypothetical protein